MCVIDAGKERADRRVGLKGRRYVISMKITASTTIVNETQIVGESRTLTLCGTRWWALHSQNTCNLLIKVAVFMIKAIIALTDWDCAAWSNLESCCMQAVWTSDTFLFCPPGQCTAYITVSSQQVLLGGFSQATLPSFHSPKTGILGVCELAIPN